MFKVGTAPTFALIAALGALTLLVMAAVVAPGCTGPRFDGPCDFISMFKAATKPRGHSPYMPIAVVDLGSSVYVEQYAPEGRNFMLHTPGVLIDRKSCRVCQVDFYATGGEGSYRVIQRAPADRPLDDKVGWFGW